MKTQDYFTYGVIHSWHFPKSLLNHHLCIKATQNCKKKERKPCPSSWKEVATCNMDLSVCRTTLTELLVRPRALPEPLLFWRSLAEVFVCPGTLTELLVPLGILTPLGAHAAWVALVARGGTSPVLDLHNNSANQLHLKETNSWISSGPLRIWTQFT